MYRATDIRCNFLSIIRCQPHPGSVQMNKVNWSANNENEYIYNFRLLQQGLMDNYIEKDIEINRLSKGKQQELNDLLQWIYEYYRKFKNDYGGAYNSKRNRGNKNFIFTSHYNKNNYRKKQIFKDNYTNISLSSNNNINSDINSNYSNYNNRKNYFNNFNNLKKKLKK